MEKGELTVKKEEGRQPKVTHRVPQGILALSNARDARCE